MQIFVETPRLILREIVESDVDGFFELDSDPEVHRFLGNRTVQSKEESMAVIKFVRQQYIDFGIGRWAVIEKQSGSFIGWCGIKFVTEEVNNHTNYYDLGYRLIRKHWGKGYATESATICVKYAFDKLRLNQLFAAAHTENVLSNRILVNLGFKKVSVFVYDQSLHNWYVKENQ